MRFLETIIFLIVSLLYSCGYVLASCGTERWNVKVLSDADLARVNFDPQQTTVSWLVDQSPPANEGPANHRVGLEFRTFQITARVVGVQTQQDDDYHIVLADPNDPSKTMIAEIPLPSCGNQEFANKFAAARKFVDHHAFIPDRCYRKLAHPILAQVIGVGFFDRVHGEKGGAPNGIEIHPVLEIRKK